MDKRLQKLGPSLIDRGFQIVPIHHGRKNPMGGKGWQERPLTRETVARYNGAGIGILASVGPHPIRPVDIDCPWEPGARAAEELATRILGDTVIRVGEWPKRTLYYRAAEAGWGKRFSAKFTHPAHLVKRSRDGLEDDWVEKPGVLQIEFLGKGNQSVIFGIHPSTGKEFEWTDWQGGLICVAPEDLPVITLEQESEFIAAWEKWMRANPEITEPNPPWSRQSVAGYTPPLPTVQPAAQVTQPAAPANASVVQPKPPAPRPADLSESAPPDVMDITEMDFPKTNIPLERAAEMLAAVHPDTGQRLFDPNCQRAEWLQVGMALHHGYNGGAEALDVWIDWSSGWSSWAGPEDCIYQWRNGMKGERGGRNVVTMGTVAGRYKEAFPDKLAEIAQDAKTEEVWEQSARPLFPLVSASELTAKPVKTEWLVENIIEQGSLDLLFGEPGAGKSLFALDWGFCVAAGRDWHGHRTQQTDVVIVAGEGHAGMARRLRALEIKYGIKAPSNLYVSKRSAQLQDANNAQWVAASIEALCPNPGLVIIDTMHRNTDGDENSSQDVGKFLSNLEQFTKRLGAAVLVVHHSGHGDKQRSRGSSSIRAAMDGEFSATKSEGAITLACHKAKDFEAFQSMQFGLKPVDLGWLDDDGILLTSVYLEFKGSGKQLASQAGKLSARDHIILSALHDAIEAHGVPPLPEIEDKLGVFDPVLSGQKMVVSIDHWRQKAYQGISIDSKPGEDKTDAKKRAFRRCRDKLLSLGVTNEFSDFAWTT